MRPKRKRELKNRNLAHQKHCDFLDKLEELSLSAFDKLMSLAVIDVIKVVRSKKLKKSDDLHRGWTGDVPKISLNFENIIDNTLEKYFLALKWILYGDLAGPEALEAAIQTGMTDDYVPGIIPSAYLDSIDANREHFKDIFDVKSPGIKKEILKESIDNIKKRTERFADESFQKLQNRLISSSEEIVTQTNTENLNSVIDSARKMISDGVSSKEAVKTAVNEVVDKAISSTSVSRALKEAIESYRKDFELMVNTDVGLASGLGSHQSMVEIFARKDDDVKIAIIAMRDEKTCSFCDKVSRKGDGSFKIYRLTDFEPTGYNYGKKKDQWKPTLGASHPRCRCMPVYIPSGFTVNNEGSLVPL